MHEQNLSLRTKFLTRARTEKVQTIYPLMSAELVTVLDAPEFHDIKALASFACTPEDIRKHILTDNFFHDDGTTAELFESMPYLWALHFLVQYQKKDFPIKSGESTAYVKFLLNESQLRAVKFIARELTNNQGKLIYLALNEQYDSTQATLTAQLIGYPQYPHHAYGYRQDTDPLKTIAPTILKEARVACQDDPSVTNAHMFYDACKKNLDCYGFMLPKWTINIATLAYNLYCKNSVTKEIASFFLDTGIIGAHAKGYSSSKYSYATQRLALEMLAGAIMYTVAPETVGSSFWCCSIIPYLVANLPLAYYVRKHERYPNTFILGQPQKQNTCTLL